MKYQKSSITPPPPPGLFFQALLIGGGVNIEGGLKREGGLFNLEKLITCSKNTVVYDREDLRYVEFKSLLWKPKSLRLNRLKKTL